MPRFLVLALGLALSFGAQSQATKISLVNPSFEGIPQASQTPIGWFSNGFPNESPPDIQPGPYGCTLRPVDGNTYMGLVTRDNNTWEDIGQPLRQPLVRSHLYEFSVCIAVSDNYHSFSRLNNKEVNYDGPVRLRIWGSNSREGRRTLIAESPVIQDKSWNRYLFLIRPVHYDVDVVIFEAFYGDGKRYTNGNLLLDNCSAFILKPDSANISKTVVAETPERAISTPSTLKLFNPSFEDGPPNFVPIGWEQSADSFYTDYRVHPAKSNERLYYSNSGQLYVLMGDNAIVPYLKVKPHHGKRYLSLLASEQNQRQQVSQRLEGYLQQDSTYTFSLALAFSRHFREETFLDGKITHFKNPLRLRIWGGTSENPNQELLAVSPAVSKKAWEQYDFRLQPRQGNYNWITLEAWYVSDTGAPYNGNILLDNCSNIERVR